MITAVLIIGEQLVDHADRIGDVTTLGLDGTLFARVGRFRAQTWSTQIVDVCWRQLHDVVQDRSAPEPCRWLAERDRAWLDRIELATLDLSASDRTVFDTTPPHAIQVSDPFHFVELANTTLDECRHRMIRRSCGLRGRRDDQLLKAWRRPSIARERHSDDQHQPMIGLLLAGDPRQNGRLAWRAKEMFRQIYCCTTAEHAKECLAETGHGSTVSRLGHAITRLAGRFEAWQISHVPMRPRP